MQAATSAPSRSIEQRMDALRRANEIRTTRAHWKIAVKRREIDPLDVLEEPPAEFETAKVIDVLLAMPKIGRVKANTLLRRAAVSPSKTLGGMTDRQRHELVSMLRWR